MTIATIERPGPLSSKPVLRNVQSQMAELDIQDLLSKINNRVYSAEAIIAMLIYVCGGEMEKSDRPSDSEAFGLYQTLHAAAKAIRELGKKKELAFPLAFWDAVYAFESTTKTLESVLSSNDLENPFGDSTMDGLFMAMKTSLSEIAESIALQLHT